MQGNVFLTLKTVFLPTFKNGRRLGMLNVKTKRVRQIETASDFWTDCLTCFGSKFLGLLTQDARAGWIDGG